MRRLLSSAVLVAALTAAASTAQDLTLEREIGAAPNGPPRNATMQQVEASHGTPLSRTGPVGDPLVHGLVASSRPGMWAEAAVSWAL